ncbi:MAG: alpha/beta hydrolase [Bacteroidota bacterium]
MSSKDIKDLRKALGYEQFSLMGFSYGSHLGQTYMKYFPNSVARSILIGTEGLDHTCKTPLSVDIHLQKIAGLVAADENIGAQVSDFAALYQEAKKKLDKEPAVIEVQSPLTGEMMQMSVASFGLDLILFFDLGDASDIPAFPRLLHQINQGNYDMLR